MASSHSAKLHPIDLEVSPLEVAERLSQLGGLVFFDSSGNLPENYKKPQSIISAEPVKVLKGKDCEFAEVQALIEKYKGSAGGVYGWVDYDGDFCFGVYPHCLVYGHNEKQWYEAGELSSQLIDPEFGDFEIGEFRNHMSRQEYVEKVERVQEYIRAGDIYQVNLTQKFSAEIKGKSLLSLYRALRNAAPAPMAAYLSIGGKEILSSSPETFLRMEGRKIETRPIKGTRPRFTDSVKDKASAEELINSDKERAELVMITDLERNDLGQVCEYGSVKVDEMLKLETLEHVYHLVSTVSGDLREDVDHLSALKECFPGGSITGAPKKRAMEIIDELENVPRGLYTGAIGYVGFDEVSQFNIVIRTLVREGSNLEYHVGAGVVADSDADAEYEETLHKAKGVRKALQHSHS